MMRSRKLAVIGSHGTGKTTLANALFAKYKRSRNARVQFVRDYARACPYPVGETTTVQAQLWIFESYLADEAQHECDMVFDGSSLQTLAYYEYWFGKNEDLRNRLKTVVNLLTTVIFLPVDARLCCPDGVRPQNNRFQNDIHGAILSLLREFDVEYVALPFYDRRDRMRFVEELVDSM